MQIRLCAIIKCTLCNRAGGEFVIKKKSKYDSCICVVDVFLGNVIKKSLSLNTISRYLLFMYIKMCKMVIKFVHLLAYY